MQRDLQADGLKFILIVLVVLGHMDQYIGFNSLCVTKYIYAFHMPVFIFLSGYFTSIKTERHKFFQWIKKTLIVFFVVQTLQNVISYFGHLGLTKMSLLYLVPSFALWYLLSLIYWRIGLRWIATKISSLNLIFLLSCLLAFVVNFVPIGNELSFHRTFTFAPFFVLGYIFKQKGGIKRLEQYPYWPFVFLIIICLFVSKYLPIYVPVRPMELRAFIATSLVAMILCISIVRVSRIKFVERFSSWGKYTLWIYIGHTFLIMIQNKLLIHFDIPMSMPLAFLFTIVQVALITFIAKMYDEYKVRKHM